MEAPFMQKTKRAPKTTSKTPGITGTYVYDKDSDSVVKISDRIPSVASKKGSSSSMPDMGPCGKPTSECGGGSCMSGGGFD